MSRRVFSLPILFLIALTAACTAVAPSAPASSRLENTPRHDEWVDVAQGSRSVKSYVVYPQRSDRAPAILLIHENRGLTDWVRTVADRLAENGYIVVAPDLLSGMAPGGGNTRDFESEDAARTAIGALSRQQVLADLRAVGDYAKKIPAASGRLAVAGFCWGGSRSWDVVTNIGGVDAAFVFYGTGPTTAEAVAAVSAPVYGFYGGNDARVNATIPQTAEAMKVAGRQFDPVIYEGAGHAFMRLGELPDADPANVRAREEAWKRWLDLLKARLGGRTGRD